MHVWIKSSSYLLSALMFSRFCVFPDSSPPPPRPYPPHGPPRRDSAIQHDRCVGGGVSRARGRGAANHFHNSGSGGVPGETTNYWMSCESVKKMIGCDSELCIRLSNGGSARPRPPRGNAGWWKRMCRHPFVISDIFFLNDVQRLRCDGDDGR